MFILNGKGPFGALESSFNALQFSVSRFIYLYTSGDHKMFLLQTSKTTKLCFLHRLFLLKAHTRLLPGSPTRGHVRFVFIVTKLSKGHWQSGA